MSESRSRFTAIAEFFVDKRVQLALVVLAVGLPSYSLVHLWIQVGRTLEHGPFANTSNFYASPRMVSKDDSLTPEQLIGELTASGYSDARENSLGYFRRTDAAVVEIHPGADSYFRAEPAQIRFAKSRIAEIKMLDNGQHVNEYFLEPELIANVGGSSRDKRRLVTYSKIPKALVNAVLSAEDKRFFTHWGFDPLRLMKAMYVDVRSGRKEQGGSTLTMQLARALWLDQAKNYGRKVNELLITLMLEMRLNKQEIFEHYANEVYLGEHHTYAIHGFGEAARVYFKKDLENLTLGESALLAALIQRPSFLQPFQHPDRAVARRNLILSMMRQNGFIGDSELDPASKEKLQLNNDASDFGDAPYFVALAIDEANTRLPRREGEQPIPRRIYTTIDPDLQRMAVESVQDSMPAVDKLLIDKYGKEAKQWGPPQVALVALDPRTGEVKAAVGGRNYQSSQLNHVISKRQPGSVFKPFVYAAALNNTVRGRSGPITPASTLMDEPHRFWFHHEPYDPGNFGDQYYGQVTLRQALAHSLNVATVSLAEEIGYSRVTDLAHQAGLNQDIQPTPAMALGAYETTPLEIAGAYTMFANQGTYTKPRFITSVRDARNGQTLLADKPEQRQVLDERINYLMVDMLQEVMNSGTAAGVRGMGFYAPAAGKTGTSRDGWFAGFTSELITVVWVGFDDNRELNLEGARSALPVWTNFMKKASARSRYAPRELARRPNGVVQAEVDPETGLIPGPNCPYKQWSFFLQGQEPKEECHEHDNVEPEPAGEVPRNDVVFPGGKPLASSVAN